MIELPLIVRQKVAQLGDEGARWLSDLPALVAELEQRWEIVAGPALSGGTAAFVALARTNDGRDVALKIAVPGIDHPVSTISAADGRGYVRLLAHDPDHRAMLMEGLGPSMDTLGLPPERQIVLLCRTLRQAWTVPRTAAQEPETDKATLLGRMVGELWEKLGRPCGERVVERALTYAERRAAAFDLDRCVVVHGDPHPANALRVPQPRQGAESGFVFVDPDGFLAEPAYDLGVVLRDWGPQLTASADPLALARRYCHLLAAESGHDEAAIWEWGFLERVSTGLYALDFGAEVLGRPYLTTAELLGVETP